MAFKEVTLVYDDSVQGFPSFFTWVSDTGISLNNRFFTFKDASIYEHHSPEAKRNEFYGGIEESTVEVVFNDQPSTLKNFKTIGYEGEGTWSAEIRTDQESTVIDDQVIPPTRTVSGTIAGSEFKSKEGKKFGYIRGTAETVDNLNLQRIDVQGLGVGILNGLNTKITFNNTPPIDLKPNDTLFYYQKVGDSFNSDLHLAGTVGLFKNVIDVEAAVVGDTRFFTVMTEAAVNTLVEKFFFVGDTKHTVTITDDSSGIITFEPALEANIEAGNITFQGTTDEVFLDYQGDEFPTTGDFFLFAKNAIVETSGVLGFYGNVKLSQVPDNPDAEPGAFIYSKAELFSINTEQFQSSK